MPFLRRCYDQTLRPRRYLSKFSNSFCRHAGTYVSLNPHLGWQATESYVERSGVFALIPGHMVLADCPVGAPPSRVSRRPTLNIAGQTSSGFGEKPRARLCVLLAEPPLRSPRIQPWGFPRPRPWHHAPGGVLVCDEPLSLPETSQVRHVERGHAALECWAVFVSGCCGSGSCLPLKGPTNAPTNC